MSQAEDNSQQPEKRVSTNENPNRKPSRIQKKHSSSQNKKRVSNYDDIVRKSSGSQNSPCPKTEKRGSQYEDLMRKFSESHKERCNAVSVNLPKTARPLKQFPTGSQYEGTWDVLGMSGTGLYTFPNGVKYKGEFDDGEFHGMGELHYPSGEIIKGKFHHGDMVDRLLVFADGLEYGENDWMYCQMPDRSLTLKTCYVASTTECELHSDHINLFGCNDLYNFGQTSLRFTMEYEVGVKPAGKSFMTADLRSRDIPPGYYDTEDGFYEPKTKMVYKSEDLSAITRSPFQREQKWISENCRIASCEPVGPRMDLYEDWMEPETDPRPPPLPAAMSAGSAYLFKTSEIMFEDESDRVSMSDYNKWLRRFKLSGAERRSTN